MGWSTARSPVAGVGGPVWSLEPGDVLAGLNTSRRGLAGLEATARRARAGPNVLPQPARRPVAAELAARLANMFAVVLVVAAGLTFLIYFLSSPRDAADLELAFGILGVVVLNAVIGFAQEHADCRVIEAHELSVEMAALTGESQPVGRTADQVQAGALAAAREFRRGTAAR